MKYNIPSKISLAIAVGLLCLQSIASAQESTNTKRAALLERMQEVSKQLNLTPEQKAQLKPIFQAEMQEIKALREDKSLSPRQKLQKLKEIREEIAPQVKAILTPEQFAKWQEIRKENREKISDEVRGKIKNRFRK